MFYEVDGCIKYRIFSLNNEEGYKQAIDILDSKPFELLNMPNEEKDVENVINVSDDSIVSNFLLPISCITGFKLCNKNI